jgi:hypothetical protein
MKTIKRYLLMLAAMGAGLTSALAQQAEKVEMADTMRAEGKIYVVVAMILIVLTGLIIYLISLDRKVTRLEGRLKDKN